jgi:hypothetical protein
MRATLAHNGRVDDRDPGLPPAPASPVGDDGQPRFGAYAGTTDVSWARLASPRARNPLWRLLHAKRWHYVSIGGPRVVAAVAIVDVGYAANVFAYVFDRAARRLAGELSAIGLPGLQGKVAPGPRGPSSFGTLARIEPRGDGWQVAVRAPGLELVAELGAPAAPPLCAIAKIDGGVANCTHKTVGLPARGLASCNGARIDLEDHTGAMDHTSGLLARDTTWRWASAARADLALNLVQGFNGPVENVVWHDGRLHAVGAVDFDYDAASRLGIWRIRSRDGAVDLSFQPEGERRQDKDLLVAASRYVQPIGVFSGTIRLRSGAIAVADLPGVTEDHRARW